RVRSQSANEEAVRLTRGRNGGIDAAYVRQCRARATRREVGTTRSNHLVGRGSRLSRPEELCFVRTVRETGHSSDLVDQAVPGLPGTLVVPAVVRLRSARVRRRIRVVAVANVRTVGGWLGARED